MKFIALIFSGILLGFFISIVSDRLLGAYLYRSGYFKATKPNITQVYETDEFSYVATISSQGIRNDEVIIPKPEGFSRILALGDSFTFGWGVNKEDTWVKLLENDLRKQGKKIEIINAAYPGLNPEFEIDICRIYADYFQTDAIILGLYSTEDLYDLIALHKENNSLNKLKGIWPVFTRLFNPYLFGEYDKDTPKILNSSQYWTSRASLFIKNNPALVSILAPEILSSYIHGRINPTIIEVSSQDPGYFTAMLNPNGFNKALRLLDESFTKLKKCGGKRPVLIAFFPSQELVNIEFFKYRHDLGFKTDNRLLDFDVDTPISALTQKHGFQYVSFLSDFRKRGCLDCYYKWDSHLTVLGNQLIADKLSPQIKRIFSL